MASLRKADYLHTPKTPVSLSVEPSIAWKPEEYNGSGAVIPKSPDLGKYLTAFHAGKERRNGEKHKNLPRSLDPNDSQ